MRIKKRNYQKRCNEKIGRFEVEKDVSKIFELKNLYSKLEKCTINHSSMKNTEIKYNLSKDYKRLYELLRNGNEIVAFSGISVNNNVSKDYSKIVVLSFNKEYEQYNLGTLTVWHDQIFDVIGFSKICESENIQFFDLQNIINNNIKELARLTKNKYVPILHDDYDDKMINAMVEFGSFMCKKYQDWILNGYVPNSTILEIIGTDDTLNDFLSCN